MTPEHEHLLLGFETHHPSTISEALSSGVDANAPIGGKTPLTWLLEMYSRSARFSECVATLFEAGAACTAPGLRAVLLDDAEAIRHEAQRDRALLAPRVRWRCAFTPLIGASLLHVAAEYGLANAAEALLDAGIDIEARADLDEHGFNGHTAIFHTVNSPFNHSQPVLTLLLGRGARTDLRLAGIIWGKGFEWETPIFDPTPYSYAQCGLLPQFQRTESDIYENIRLLAEAAGRGLPPITNVPNAYLSH